MLVHVDALHHDGMATVLSIQFFSTFPGYSPVGGLTQNAYITYGMEKGEDVGGKTVSNS